MSSPDAQPVGMGHPHASSRPDYLVPPSPLLSLAFVPCHQEDNARDEASLIRSIHAHERQTSDALSVEALDNILFCFVPGSRPCTPRVLQRAAQVNCLCDWCIDYAIIQNFKIFSSPCCCPSVCISSATTRRCDRRWRHSPR